MSRQAFGAALALLGLLLVVAGVGLLRVLVDMPAAFDAGDAFALLLCLVGGAGLLVAGFFAAGEDLPWS